MYAIVRTGKKKRKRGLWISYLFGIFRYAFCLIYFFTPLPINIFCFFFFFFFILKIKKDRGVKKSRDEVGDFQDDPCPRVSSRPLWGARGTGGHALTAQRHHAARRRTARGSVPSHDKRPQNHAHGAPVGAGERGGGGFRRSDPSRPCRSSRRRPRRRSIRCRPRAPRLLSVGGTWRR
jgi:hypothetical protein